MNATTNTKPAAETLEIETCTRCGGSGSYSYCQSHGTKCFKCGGKGKTLTKRGAAAAAHLEALRSKRVDALVEGDEVWFSGVPGYIAGHWDRVLRLEVTDVTGWDVNGVPVAPGSLLTIVCAGGNALGRSPETLVRVKQSAEQRVATLRAAIAYQATLTKAGTPRKR